MLGRARLEPRAYFGLTYVRPAPDAVTTSRSVVHSPCGSIRTLKVKPSLSSRAGAEAEISVSEDDLKRSEKEVQDITKSFEARIDEAVAHKEKEVLEV